MIVVALGTLASAGCSTPSPGVVVGTVTEAPGVPCAGCAIGLTPLNPGLTVIELARYTDSDGRFRVDRLQPGEYRVSAFRGASAAKACVVVDPVRTTVIDLEVP